MRYDYDMLGNRIHQASMEAGERWMLNDVAGKPIRAWDSRDHQFRTAYDALRRPTRLLPARRRAAPELLVGRTVYGESRAQPGGRATCAARSFSSSIRRASSPATPTTSRATCCAASASSPSEYKTTLDWSAAVPLEAETYTSRTRYDALNRPTSDRTAQRRRTDSVIQPGLQRGQPAGAGRRPTCAARGEPPPPFVTNIDYDAKGQRTRIDYGNGVSTDYTYDPLDLPPRASAHPRNAALSRRLPAAAATGWPGCQVQNLHYTYDPAGNITHIRDDAQQTDLLPQPARRAERRLHLRRALPADRGHRPRAPGPDRRRARSADAPTRSTASASSLRPSRATATRWARTSSATSTTPSATSCRCSIAAATRRIPAGRAPTPTTRPA